MAGSIASPIAAACCVVSSASARVRTGPSSSRLATSSTSRPSALGLAGPLERLFVPRSSHIVRAVASELSDFSVQESSKFREGLLEQLQANQETAGHKIEIADICTKIFGNYLEKYDGTLSHEPFGEMKAALDSEGLPGAVVAILAAVGWSRGYLYNDWRTWKAQK